MWCPSIIQTNNHKELKSYEPEVMEYELNIIYQNPEHNIHTMA